MLGCKPIDAPIESNHKSGEKNEEHMVNRGIYQWMARKLIYSSHTKPNIHMLQVWWVSLFILHLSLTYRVMAQGIFELL